MATAAASASGRRRGQRELAISWGAVFCFGGRRGRGEEAPAPEGTTTPRERSRTTTRRRKRTVPVDGDLVPGTAGRHVMSRGADDDEGSPRGPGPRLLGCCFLAPARAPAGGTKRTMHSSSGSSTHSKQRQLEHAGQRARSPSEAPETWRIQATDGGGPAETRAPTSTRPCGSEGPSESEASACAQASAGVGAFGPEVGLAVVAAVSMAGLLGGRLWAVACVCAWLAVLSRLRRREARPPGGGPETLTLRDAGE